MIALERLNVAEQVTFQHDPNGPGSALAQIGVWVPHPHWPHLNACAYATVSVHHEGTYLVDGHMTAGDAGQTQWNLMRTFHSRDEAAAEAAAFLAVALELLAQSVAGEPFETPGQRRAQAAQQARSAVPMRAQLAERVDELLRAVSGAQTVIEKEILAAKHRAARDDLRRWDERFVDVFHQEHHWSEFA